MSSYETAGAVPTVVELHPELGPGVFSGVPVLDVAGDLLGSQRGRGGAGSGQGEQGQAEREDGAAHRAGSIV